MRDGRVVRAIYPARALEEAPEVLLSRAEIGEQIRVVPEVHTRLAVVGPRRAMLPDPPGPARTDAWSSGSGGWSRCSWPTSTRSGTPRPGGPPAPATPEPDLRRLLLTQLADGAKDEQIARTLGISLRTVRRRVAALMSDLGVDTRFPAGVEAVRRGWI